MILVFDTSTNHLAIGIANDDGVLQQEFRAEAALDERGIHDARLASETSRLLAGAHVSPSEISRIGLIIGPGSFTGLRIGLSFAKGLALATGAVLVPLTQHEAIAAEMTEAHAESIVVPGYRADLFYLADSRTPRDIRLVSRDQLQSSLLPPRTHPSLSSLALLTATATTTVSGEPLDALEPLYLTEFKVS